MSGSVRPHRWQPTRLPHPWDSPDKNTGVGCHFLLQCMKVKSESEVSQSCLTLSNPMDRSLPGSAIHGIFQARVLEWGAIAFSYKTSSVTQMQIFVLYILTGFKICFFFKAWITTFCIRAFYTYFFNSMSSNLYCFPPLYQNKSFKLLFLNSFLV